MKIGIRAFFNVAARLWLGGIFFTTGWIKAVEPYENFRGVLSQYGLLSQNLVPLAAHTVPWVELIMGLFLVLGYALPAAVMVSGLLSGTFVLLIGISLLTGAALPAHCGCFGAMIDTSPVQMFVLDAVHLALAFLLLRYPSSFLSLDGLFLKPSKN
ncbi:MAG: DoxX family membrane protein [Candidatus Omnitrophica bacterium]|nr:DoxX family membrane protein [Candidatus Omnitrophota bacterium]